MLLLYIISNNKSMRLLLTSSNSEDKIIREELESSFLLHFPNDILKMKVHNDLLT